MGHHQVERTAEETEDAALDQPRIWASCSFPQVPVATLGSMAQVQHCLLPCTQLASW